MSELEQAVREKRLVRIRRVSTFMKWAVTIVVALILVLAVVVTIGISMPNDLMLGSEETIDVGDYERALGDVPQAQRIGLALIFAAAHVMLAIATLHIRAVFLHFQKMEFFSPKALSNVISFGIWLIAFAVFDLLGDPIASVILTADLPEGQRSLELALNGDEIFFLVFGGLMLLFGWILREAALIADENRQFV
ncbi:MAG: DUF2975 domain-containing protein [Roseibium sp.]|nr:DUF2975 domain-containing protein [Roseibium sp.]